MKKCKDSRDYIPEYVDIPGGGRTVKMSNCMPPVEVIDAPTNPAPPAPKDDDDE